MSLDQLDRWFLSLGCERAEKLAAPPELAGRPAYYLPMTGGALPAPKHTGKLAKRVTLTTPARDRQGDVIVPTGARLRWFRANPVVLWAHRCDLPPIGRVDPDSLRVSEQGIEADVLFDEGSVVGREVYGLYDRGVMRAWSVGFIPLKWKVIEDPATHRAQGYRVEEWELLELSAVPVPANPEALTRETRRYERLGCDPRLLPVVKALQAAVAASPESPLSAAQAQPGPAPAKGAATSPAPAGTCCGSPPTAGSQRVPGTGPGDEGTGAAPAELRAALARCEKEIAALRGQCARMEQRIQVLVRPAAEPTQRVAGQGLGWTTELAEAAASKIVSALPSVIRDRVSHEFLRLRGGAAPA